MYNYRASTPVTVSDGTGPVSSSGRSRSLGQEKNVLEQESELQPDIVQDLRAVHRNLLRLLDHAGVLVHAIDLAAERLGIGAHLVRGPLDKACVSRETYPKPFCSL